MIDWDKHNYPKELEDTKMKREERAKVYNRKRQEILDLLDVMKERKEQGIPLKHFDGDLEEEINRLTFLAVKLRQIVRYTEGGN